MRPTWSSCGVRRTDVPTFIRCHLNAFDYFVGVPRRCLYDNAKVVVLERDGRLAVHPKAHRRGQRVTLPGQWEGLVNGETRPKCDALAVQMPAQQMERHLLDIYELVAVGGVRRSLCIRRAGTRRHWV